MRRRRLEKEREMETKRGKREKLRREGSKIRRKRNKKKMTRDDFG